MGKPLRRLRAGEWRAAVDALRHAEADWECWESDSDHSAKNLLIGIKVLQMLIDDRRPSKDWAQLTQGGEDR